MLKRSLLLISLTLFSASCSLIPSAHRIEITQGSVIEQESIDKLTLGMTEEQVKFVMGSPSIQDIFHPNRWDYIHYVDRQRQALVNQQLTLVFKDGLLSGAKSKDFDVASLQAPPVAPTAVVAPEPSYNEIAETTTASAVVAISELGNTATATPAVAPAIEPETSKQEQVKISVNNWARAWSEQNVAHYVASYVKNYSTNSSHSAWLKQRTNKLTRPKSIAIGIAKLEVMLLDENTARAEFEQSYKSNTYQDKVIKQMTLSLQDGSWKISAEKTLKPLE